jgi:hypothetical protein
MLFSGQPVGKIGGQILIQAPEIVNDDFFIIVSHDWLHLAG